MSECTFTLYKACSTYLPFKLENNLSNGEYSWLSAECEVPRYHTLCYFAHHPSLKTQPRRLWSLASASFSYSVIGTQPSSLLHTPPWDHWVSKPHSKMQKIQIYMQLLWIASHWAIWAFVHMISVSSTGSEMVGVPSNLHEMTWFCWKPL